METKRFGSQNYFRTTPSSKWQLTCFWSSKFWLNKQDNWVAPYSSSRWPWTTFIFFSLVLTLILFTLFVFKDVYHRRLQLSQDYHSEVSWIPFTSKVYPTYCHRLFLRRSPLEHWKYLHCHLTAFMESFLARRYRSFKLCFLKGEPYTWKRCSNVMG